MTALERRVAKLQAMIVDAAATAGEKANAAETLATLYRKHPDLAVLAAPKPAVMPSLPAPPKIRVTPKNVAKAARLATDGMAAAGVITRSTASEVHGILDEFFAGWEGDEPDRPRARRRSR